MSGELGSGERGERNEDGNESENLEGLRKRILAENGPDGTGNPHETDKGPAEAIDGGQEDEFAAFAKELEKYHLEKESNSEEQTGARPEELIEPEDEFEKLARELQEKYPIDDGGKTSFQTNPDAEGGSERRALDGSTSSQEPEEDRTNLTVGMETDSSVPHNEISPHEKPQSEYESDSIRRALSSKVEDIEHTFTPDKPTSDFKANQPEGAIIANSGLVAAGDSPGREKPSGPEVPIGAPKSSESISYMDRMATTNHQERKDGAGEHATNLEATAASEAIRTERLRSDSHQTGSPPAKLETGPTLQSPNPESSVLNRVEAQAGLHDSEPVTSTRHTERLEQRPPTFTLKAYEYQIPGREPNIRFDIRSKDFQKRTGVEMREGKVYEIKGKIGEVGFTKDHLEKEGNHVIIMVPRERQGEISPGKRYDIAVESVEEKTKFVVEGYGDGRAVLGFQPTVLSSLGLDLGKARESGVVSFQVENSSKPMERMRTLFTRIELSDNAARLAVTGLGWKRGDIVKVHKVTDYSREDFVKGFNESRDTKRARLLSDGDKLNLEVDGRPFPITDCRFETHSLKVNLSGKMEPALRELRFWYDGEHFTPKIRDCRILQFRASKYELKLVHEESNHRITASRFTIPEASERPIISRPLDVEMFRQNVVVLPRTPRPEGKYEFEVEHLLNSYADEWLRASNQGQRSQRLGAFAEELASEVLEDSKWSFVRKHPSVRKNGAEVGSNKPGFDRLMRWEPSGELGLFEVKWQQNLDTAFSGARGDVRERIRKKPWILKDPEKGAFIAILDWRQNERQGTLYVERLWPADPRSSHGRAK